MSDEITWIDVVERKQSVLFASFITKEDNRKYCLAAGIDYAMRDYKYADGLVSFSSRDMNSLFMMFYDRLHKEDKFLSTFADACYAQCDSLISKAKEIEAMRDLKGIGRIELLRMFEDYAQEAFKLLPYLYSANVIEILLHQEISKGLKERLADDDDEVNRYLSLLIIPSKENDLVSEMNDLLRIGADLQKDTRAAEVFSLPTNEIEENLISAAPGIYDRVIGHVSQYGWLNIHSGYLGEPISVREVILRLRTLLRRDCDAELTRRESGRASREQRFQEAVMELGISGKLLETVNNARDFIDVRMQRINAYFIAHYHARNMIRAIASELGVTYEDVLYMTYEEIVACLKDERCPATASINSRKAGYAVVMIDGRREFYTGEELRKLVAERDREEVQSVEVFEGMTACTGETLADVKVLMDVNDVHKVEDGDIVVSPMTTPDLMPALEKASGIITDEGGILCHAAIVSRELGIPCVIGTRKATKVLKDGDTVSLIAGETKGVIRLVGDPEKVTTSSNW